MLFALGQVPRLTVHAGHGSVCVSQAQVPRLTDADGGRKRCADGAWGQFRIFLLLLGAGAAADGSAEGGAAAVQRARAERPAAHGHHARAGRHPAAQQPHPAAHPLSLHRPRGDAPGLTSSPMFGLARNDRIPTM